MVKFLGWCVIVFMFVCIGLFGIVLITPTEPVKQFVVDMKAVQEIRKLADAGYIDTSEYKRNIYSISPLVWNHFEYKDKKKLAELFVHYNVHYGQSNHIQLFDKRTGELIAKSNSLTGTSIIK